MNERSIDVTLRARQRRRRFAGVFFATALLPGLSGQQQPTLPAPVKKIIEFQSDIAPILARCVDCHGPATQSGGLRLDNRGDAMHGGASGPVIQPGESAKSRLIHLVAGFEPKRVMPMGAAPLSGLEVSFLRAWIDQGAEWNGNVPTVSPAASQQPAKKHWAFVPPRKPPLPTVNNKEWGENAIDRFILTRLEKEGITPSPEAGRATLLRRLSLDLIGLPPSPDEIDVFLADQRPDAYERQVDRLLKSPHYGEKWARHWLDLARYADSDGYETDQLRPWAWRWRHWVTDALNRDMPFDEFTIEQLAGDLLPGATIEQRVATGFHRNTLSNREGGADLEEFRVEQVVDRAAATGVVWLGLTVGCARCHDHKFDPITQQDFYQIYAFFNSADEVNIDAPLPGEIGPFLASRAEYEARRGELLAPVRDELEQLQIQWEQKLLEADRNPGHEHTWDRAWEVLGLIWGGNFGEGQLEGQHIVKLDPDERTKDQRERLFDYFLQRGSKLAPERFEELKINELSARVEKLKGDYPHLSRAPVFAESTQPPVSYVHVRGDFRQHGVEVQPDVPAVLPPLPTDSVKNRLALARWLVSPRNPLTARVAVNRMWQEFFGQGLVSTSGDFGTQGEEPTHPELLDWLATEFIARGWSVKQMHKLIVMSATYRQSSGSREELAERDPGNHLLARQSRLRLHAEQLRDSALAVSGLLDDSVGGPSVRPPQPKEAASYGYDTPWVESTGGDRYRRGLYTWMQRTSPYAQSVTFDLADPNQVCSRRERSNTPLQALTLLNDPVFLEAAQAIATHIVSEGGAAPADRITYGFRLCLAREPSAEENERLLRYYREQVRRFDSDAERADLLIPVTLPNTSSAEMAAWTALSSVLLNLDEFITRP